MSDFKQKTFKEWYKDKYDPNGYLYPSAPLNIGFQDYCARVNEYMQYLANGVNTGEKQCNLPVVSGSYSYEIDFGTHCRAGIDITNNEPKVLGAVNGWGDGISLADIKIKKL